MRQTLLTLAVLVVWATVASADPLLVSWPRYVQGSTPAVRLVLWRSLNQRPFEKVVTFANVTTIEYRDRDVKWNRGTYCYRVQAEAADGTPSDLSPLGANSCGRPRK